MIEALPRGARVFDAFTGCFAVSKLLQRFGDGLHIVAEDACAHWIDGLEVCDVRLDALDALRYADGCDLMILDPPYRTPPKAWGQGEYIGRDACRDAREFCAAVISRGRCAVWLWDEPDSDLVRMATDAGGIVHAYPHPRQRQHAREVLVVLRPMRRHTKDLPLFAWARQKGLPI